MDTKLFATSFTGLCISIALLLTTQTMGAQAQETQGAAHQPAPADPVAVIHVPAPREGNLLHLRGMAGRGTVYFRKNGDCSKMPVRFVAGDFAGRDRDRDHAGPIRIVVRSPGIVRGLMRARLCQRHGPCQHRPGGSERRSAFDHRSDSRDRVCREPGPRPHGRCLSDPPQKALIAAWSCRSCLRNEGAAGACPLRQPRRPRGLPLQP